MSRNDTHFHFPVILINRTLTTLVHYHKKCIILFIIIPDCVYRIIVTYLSCKSYYCIDIGVARVLFLFSFGPRRRLDDSSVGRTARPPRSFLHFTSDRVGERNALWAFTTISTIIIIHSSSRTYVLYILFIFIFFLFSKWPCVHCLLFRARVREMLSRLIVDKTNSDTFDQCALNTFHSIVTARACPSRSDRHLVEFGGSRWIPVNLSVYRASTKLFFFLI